ncbi:MAG: PRC-barrel domain-containing protein [Ilumatobacteraceae bacterium]
MTVTLLRGADLIGRAVVDASTGNDLAEIKDVVFTADRGAITGFTLRKRGFFGRRLKTVLAIADVLSVGTGAVMVAGTEAISDPSDAPEDMATHESNDVIDDEVFTVSGRSLGTVRDVVILGGATPRVVGFEIGGGDVGGGLIPLGAQAAVSGSALIVPDDFEQRIRGDLTGLAAELSLIESSLS